MLELSFTSFIIGLAVIVLLGFGVKHVIQLHTDSLKPTRPDSLNESDWDLIVGESAGSGIGFFERVLFLIAILLGKYDLIGFWLAFKLGAKWESWSHIVGVNPNEITFPIRRRLGSWLLSRFLIGTLLNIIIASVGAYVGVKINACL